MSSHVCSASYVPAPTSAVLRSLFLAMTLKKAGMYPHSTDKQLKQLKLSHLPKVTKSANERASGCLSKEPPERVTRKNMEKTLPQT